MGDVIWVKYVPPGHPHQKWARIGIQAKTPIYKNRNIKTDLDQI